MDKKIELSQEQIEEIVDSSNMNLSEKQRNEMIANLKNGKKSPNTLILQGDIESLQDWIDDGLDVNETNFSDTPLLALAIIYSDIDIVKLLIENGANVNIVVEDKPLLAFTLMSDIEIIKLLIENGADVNVLDNNKPLVLQALMFGNNEFVKLLIENGANIEFQNNSSLLEQALLFSNTEIVELCIGKGSKFSQNILFDVVKRKDGYIFDRKDIEKIIDEKNKLRTELYDSEETYESIISKLEKIKNKMHEMKISTTNTHEQNNEISKHSQEPNKLHSRLNKIRRNLTNMINKLNDMQDNMTLLTIIDFIKVFIKYDGDVNYKDENGSTALMFLSYFGYEDCVKLLIENGAEIDIQNSSIETPLLLAYENNHFNVVKLLIDSGANVNIIMNNDESFYKKAKHDKNYEVLEWIENSPTYKKITHDPKELVNILLNFTIDTPFKLTTHLWEDSKGELFDKYGSFDGYMSAVKKQFESMQSELEGLSPNLYQKISAFLIENTPNNKYSWCSKTDINIGWSSLEGLKEWCDSGKLPKDFKLQNPIFIGRKQIVTFGEIVDLFKQEIEVKATYHIASLADFEFSKRDFYTDTQKFSTAIGKIFEQMKSEEYPQIEVSNKDLSEDRSIEIKITQVGSPGYKNAESMLQEINDGDFADIKESLKNLCDWSIESSFEDENFRVNFLHSNNVKDIEILETKPKGFTHILRFYK
jgi:hypothetical protein